MSARVLVFGREPSPGLVKTRLAATIGDEAASRVYQVLLRKTLDAAVACGAEVELWLAEEPSTLFRPIPSVPVEVQRGDDIGKRMSDAFCRCFAKGVEEVVLIGSDCPTIEATHLLQAAEALEEYPVVLGPAKDGGYWLVAQRAPGANLFSDVPWSDPDTLAMTRKRLENLGVEWGELAILDDLDTAEDFERILDDARTPRGLVEQLRHAADSTRDP